MKFSLWFRIRWVICASILWRDTVIQVGPKPGILLGTHAWTKVWTTTPNSESISTQSLRKYPFPIVNRGLQQQKILFLLPFYLNFWLFLLRRLIMHISYPYHALNKYPLLTIFVQVWVPSTVTSAPRWGPNISFSYTGWRFISLYIIGTTCIHVNCNLLCQI